MAIRCSVLAWRFPWTEEPNGLHSMGSQRVEHDLGAKQQQQGCVRGSCRGRGLGVLPTPLCWLQGSCTQYPRFAPDPRDFLQALEAVEGFSFLFFLISLYLSSRIFPNSACPQFFLVSYSFLVFCCWRRGLTRCIHCSRGSQVPACLNESPADALG